MDFLIIHKLTRILSTNCHCQSSEYNPTDDHCVHFAKFICPLTFFHNRLFKVVGTASVSLQYRKHTNTLRLAVPLNGMKNSTNRNIPFLCRETAQLLGFKNNCIMLLLHNINASDHLHFSNITLRYVCFPLK